MVIDRYRMCLESGDFAALADVYATDALLDANIPSWRLQRQGSVAIREHFQEWYATGLPRFTSWHERATDWGAVIEVEAAVGEGDAETRFREAHLLCCASDRITEHVFYCTGPWDRDTVARHAAEAPMVRAECRGRLFARPGRTRT